jgi:hypothetical protein
MLTTARNRIWTLLLGGSVLLTLLLANPVLAGGCKPSCGGG